MHRQEQQNNKRLPFLRKYLYYKIVALCRI